MMLRLLETVGIEPERLRLEWISASEATKFAQVVAEFTEQIRQLGPNPLGVKT
jgi:F420-non-reducing hydrogenase iron-sulfur subunit